VPWQVKEKRAFGRRKAIYDKTLSCIIWYMKAKSVFLRVKAKRAFGGRKTTFS
jgi:hypothetical protein